MYRKNLSKAPLCHKDTLWHKRAGVSNIMISDLEWTGVLCNKTCCWVSSGLAPAGHKK